MPKSINFVQLLGNLGRDPEVKYTPQGTPVARISLATNERFKDKSGEWKDRTEWHTVIAWARLAEIAGEYLKKGSKTLIEGTLRTRKWEKEGRTHYSTEIVASDLFLLDAPREKAEKAEKASENIHGVPITDEDIPF